MSVATPRGRNADTSRAAILGAARALFASGGYELTTVRAIAAAAAIDPAMVLRYYGSKERLFAQAMEVDLHFPATESITTGEAGDFLVRHFLALWETNGELAVMLRSAVTNEVAAAKTREVFASQVIPLMRRLGVPASEISVRASLVASQILGFALTRYVLRFDGVAAIPPEHAAAWLAPTIQRYLTGTLPVQYAGATDVSEGDTSGAE